MNKDTLEGKWTQFKGKARETWGKITDDEFEQAKGDAGTKHVAGPQGADSRYPKRFLQGWGLSLAPKPDWARARTEDHQTGAGGAIFGE